MKKGFTLIELLIVIAILGVIAAAVIAAINPAKRINQANDAALKSDVGSIATAMQAYYTLNQTYPATVAALVTSGDIKTEPKIPPARTVSYTVVRTAGTACTTAPYTNCESAIYGALNDPATAANVWCWRSSTNTAAETTVATCTAP